MKHKSHKGGRSGNRQKTVFEQHEQRQREQGRDRGDRPERRDDRRREEAPAPRGEGHWLYGWHAVTAALANEKRKVFRVLVTDSSKKELEVTLRKDILSKLPIEVSDSRSIESVAGHGSVHQGIAAQVSRLPDADLDDILRNAPRKALIVVLDQVTDPQNVGAIMRSAASFGAIAMIMHDRHSPPETASLAKAASGALEVLPTCRVNNLAEALKAMKEHGFWAVGLEGEAKNTLRRAPRYDRTALVLGAEGKGMRRLTGELCDVTAKLPMTGLVESLNVSSAAAVALYELAAPVLDADVLPEASESSE